MKAHCAGWPQPLLTLGAHLDGDASSGVFKAMNVSSRRGVIGKQIVHLLIVNFQTRDADRKGAVPRSVHLLERVRDCPWDHPSLTVNGAIAAEGVRFASTGLAIAQQCAVEALEGVVYKRCGDIGEDRLLRRVFEDAVNLQVNGRQLVACRTFSEICVSDVSCSKQQIDTIVNLAPGGGGGFSWTGSSGR
jgi:hypothetical protein